MNKKIFCFLSCLVFVSCATPGLVRGNIESYHNLESYSGKTLYLDSYAEVSRNDLSFSFVREKFEAELTIIGGFYDASLEQWAKNYDSKYNLMINWKGWINYTKLAPHFSEADIGLCILQDSERYMKAIATKVYEYIIMGLPVVTSKGHMSDRLVKKEKYSGVESASCFSKPS